MPVSYVLYKVILACLHNSLWQHSDMIPNQKKKIAPGSLEKACRWEVDFGQVPKSCAKGPHYGFMAASALRKNVTQQAKSATKIKK